MLRSVKVAHILYFLLASQSRWLISGMTPACTSLLTSVETTLCFLSWSFASSATQAWPRDSTWDRGWSCQGQYYSTVDHAKTLIFLRKSISLAFTGPSCLHPKLTRFLLSLQIKTTLTTLASSTGQGSLFCCSSRRSRPSTSKLSPATLVPVETE